MQNVFGLNIGPMINSVTDCQGLKSNILRYTDFQRAFS